MKRKLPKFNNFSLPGVSFEPPQNVLSKWDKNVEAVSTDNNAIDIYDYIGDDGFGGGFSVKRLSAALRSIDGPVTVNINSPGGDFFSGLAIYNLLREHPEEVTVKVVGLAASAASIIAMAGDDIQVAKNGFLMIHNAWVVAIGNKEDLSETMDVLSEFDSAMAELYSARTGIEKRKVIRMMTDETWMNGDESIDNGFADSLLPSDKLKQVEKTTQSALRKVDTALAKDGVSRRERRALLKEISGKPSAAESITPGADDLSPTVEKLEELLSIIKS